MALGVLLLLLWLAAATSAAAASTKITCSVELDVHVMMGEQAEETQSGWFANNYANSFTHCALYVPATPDLVVSINFLQISTEPNFDLVQVFSVQSMDTRARTVTSSAAVPLAVESGSSTTNLKGVVGQPGEILLILLKSDDNIAYRGYRALVNARLRDCHAGLREITLSSSTGAVAVPPPSSSSTFGVCWIIILPAAASDTLNLAFSRFPSNYPLQVMAVSQYNAALRTFTQQQTSGETDGGGMASTHLLFPAGTTTARRVTSKPGERMLMVQTHGDFALLASSSSSNTPATTLAPSSSSTLPPADGSSKSCSGGVAQVVHLTTLPQTIHVNASLAWCVVLAPASPMYSAVFRLTKFTASPSSSSSSRMNLYLMRVDTATEEVQDEDVGARIGQLGTSSLLPTTFTAGRRMLVQYASSTVKSSFEAVVKSALLPTAPPTPMPTMPTKRPTTARPTRRPTTRRPSRSPTLKPTRRPSKPPTLKPTRTAFPTRATAAPRTGAPTTRNPTRPPTKAPTRTAFPTRKWRAKTASPTSAPTEEPTIAPSIAPTEEPTTTPTRAPTTTPTRASTINPATLAPTTTRPTSSPMPLMTRFPSLGPFVEPIITPSPQSLRPTSLPTTRRPTTLKPTVAPTKRPSLKPTTMPSLSANVTLGPTSMPTRLPTKRPTLKPTLVPSRSPTQPTVAPTRLPTKRPTLKPTALPSKSPTVSRAPTLPTPQPTRRPTTRSPTLLPTTEAIVV